MFYGIYRLYVEIQWCDFHITLLLFYETKYATHRFVLASLVPEIQGEFVMRSSEQMLNTDMMRSSERNVYRQPDGPHSVQESIAKDILKNQLS